MSKRLLAALLLVSLISSSFSQFLIYADFELNQDYIAKNLCVNKSRPWMNCNGRCYLMKKLKAAEEKEKKQEKDNLRAQIQVAIYSVPFSFTFKKKSTLKRVYPPAVVLQPIKQASSIFQPPKWG